MSKRHVVPSISKTSFNCPHCGALASQTWFKVDVTLADNEDASFLLSDLYYNSREINRDYLNSLLLKASKGVIFLHKLEYRRGSELTAINLSLSLCYNCKKIAIWVHDRMIYPPELYGEEPNEDLPPDVLQDYQEAQSILNLSPRGTAALLRLAIQKLVKHLGEKGKDLNTDIGTLVSKGLSPLVQKSLDAVRVIGNEAVHPGTLDLRDNREVASQLFRLVNIICEQMISHPKHVNELYEHVLPKEKKEQIEKRDNKDINGN